MASRKWDPRCFSYVLTSKNGQDYDRVLSLGVQHARAEKEAVALVRSGEAEFSEVIKVCEKPLICWKSKGRVRCATAAMVRQGRGRN